MYLKEASTIRTGLVTSRLTDFNEEALNSYKLLNLKCIAHHGYINTDFAEKICSQKAPKPEFFTHLGDILIRLNVPYTIVLINKEEWINYLIPSHFAIIRTNKDILLPEYVLWFLKKEDTMQKILQNASNTSSFGTINSKFFGSLYIPNISLQKQEAIGQFQILADREQELLNKLLLRKQIYNKLMLNSIYKTIKHKEETK